MRILELEINNFRGIREKIILKPNGNNIIVVGPNGSGKSAIVDAVDFLLSGAINRLTGEGTGDISLSGYGKHIKSEVEIAWVKAKIRFHDMSEASIERHLKEPSRLICDPPEASAKFEDIRKFAMLGQHIITRREIIQFILAMPKSRADTISSLLDMSYLESTRDVLVKAHSKLSRKVENHHNAVESALEQIVETTGLDEFDEGELIECINTKRAILGAGSINDLSSSVIDDVESLIQEVLERPYDEKELEDNSSLLNEFLATDTLQKIDLELQSNLEDAKKFPDFERSEKTSSLVKRGLSLIDTKNLCPLCDHDWGKESLEKYLKEKETGLSEASKIAKKIRRLSSELTEKLDDIMSWLHKLQEIATAINTDNEVKRLESWVSNLNTLSGKLKDITLEYLNSDSISVSVVKILALDERNDLIKIMKAESQKLYPEPSEQEKVWKFLIELNENIESLSKARTKKEKAQTNQIIASKILQSYETSLATALENLYDNISSRFAELYIDLHGSDEKDFEAQIIREGAGLKITTKFHDAGLHPPVALHSEGHQDSMGFLMHLALREHITQGKMDVVVLDDIIMSIDATHRKEVSNLLARLSEYTQFIITTHDRTWAKHLRNSGVTTKSNVIEFYGWSLEHGPRIHVGKDVWDKIDNHLQNDEKVSASGMLRNALEHFFEDMCDTLKAKIVYKSDGLWTLGDYMPSAVGRTKDLLKIAANAENSYGHSEKSKEASKLNKAIGLSYSKTIVEQWVINRSLHYSNWENLSCMELKNIFASFKELCMLFYCKDCESAIMITMKDNVETGLRCNCGNISWTLIIPESK